MSVYILPSIFTAIMIICGLMAWKMPLSWDARGTGRWPCYEGKLAMQNEAMWYRAQSLYGKIQFSLGIFHAFLEIPEVAVLRLLLQHFENEDATIPAMCCLVLPAILLIILGNIVTFFLLNSMDNQAKDL